MQIFRPLSTVTVASNIEYCSLPANNKTPKLTVEALIRKGYFPTELAPLFSSAALADQLASIANLDQIKTKSSRCIGFSIPKSFPARRVLSIPNPLHQIRLASTLVKHWTEMRALLDVSTLALSTPTIFPDGARAVSRACNFDAWSIARFQRSANKRFVLRTDLSRFYHTIYTHSLPWAVHGKIKAKSDHGLGLYGNALDACVRNTQDQQTLGLPVGPDTSFILAEVIGAAIDCRLKDELPKLEGSRYVDDFHLYFHTRAEAEKAYTALARAVRYFELEVNDRKTTISEGPDTGEPIWKTAIKAQNIRPKVIKQRSSLISFVSKSFELAKDFPSQGVLAYALKKAVGTKIEEDNYDIFESFIRAALVHDSSTIEIVTKVLYERKQSGQLTHLNMLEDCIIDLSILYARAGFAYEVSWLLWLFHVLDLAVPEVVSKEISKMDDPLVALSALALNDAGMVASIDTQLWETAMNADNLYSEYWILAYEAAHRGWLPASGDYLSDDPFFSQLDKTNVSFCKLPSDSGVGYIDLPLAGVGYID